MKLKRNIWWFIAWLACKVGQWCITIWEWAVWNYTQPFREQFSEYRPTLLFDPKLPFEASLYVVKGVRGRGTASQIGLQVEVEGRSDGTE
ncbi:MAG: hypothetical protein DRJ03_14490 [Chloroflexi bacterium]|nr:MAG: hypothetical protein DRJ03_14490 [Chloroflexota bacterium]